MIMMNSSSNNKNGDNSHYITVNNVGNNILWTGYDKEGNKFYRKEHFEPTLFVGSHQETGYRSIHDENVAPIRFDSIKDAKDYCNRYEGTNKKIYGNQNYVSQFIAERFPNGIESQITSNDLNVCFFDCEMIDENGSIGFPDPADAPVPVVSIAMYFSKSERKILLGLKPSSRPDYIRCESEIDLLNRFCSIMENEEVDILTGWNIRTFDIPYVIKRLEMYLGSNGPKKLSPFSLIREKSVVVKGKENPIYDMIGIAQLDYLDVFKKFSISTIGALENYRLETVAQTVLGEGKIDYSDEYTNLTDLYNGNHEKFLEYNMRDVMALVEIDDAIKYIDIAASLAYLMGTNFIDTLGTTNLWDSYIYKELLKENLIIPPNENHTKAPYVGGYVKESIKGLHKWVASVDLASLYPNIIIQYNMSPETVVLDGQRCTDASVDRILNRETKNPMANQYAMAANGVYTRKDKIGVIPRLVEQVYKMRKSAKKEMIDLQKEAEKTGHSNSDLEKRIVVLNNLQMALKIGINSVYGAMGSPYFRYYLPQIAEGITTSGQLTIKWAENAINKKMNKIMGTNDHDYVCIMDTDSCYIIFDDLVEKVGPKDPILFIDTIMKDVFEPMFKKSYDDLAERMGTSSNRMVLEREKIARVVAVAKKRYFLHTYDDEGVRYEKPKLKVTGIEAVKSSIPQVIKNGIKECFELILMKNDEEITTRRIDELKAHFKTLEFRKIAFPRTANNIEKFLDPKDTYKKGTPIHVKAAILYNKKLREHGLENKYRTIGSGDKIVFIYLKEPNPIHNKVIGFLDFLPDEFGLNDYIDHNTQIEKAFISVLESVYEVIGWKSLMQSDDDLEAFFC